MDNSSRNIVHFIATVTVAALVLMAATYYSRSQEPQEPSADLVTTPAVEEISDEEMAIDETAADDEEIRASDTEVIVEEAEGISGEPSASVREN